MLSSKRSSVSIYFAFSFFLVVTLFLLFSSYSLEVSNLSRKAQEEFFLSLTGSRISNLLEIVEKNNVDAEIFLDKKFLLYGLRPVEYEIEFKENSINLKTGSSNFTVRAPTIYKIKIFERENFKVLEVKR